MLRLGLRSPLAHPRTSSLVEICSPPLYQTTQGVPQRPTGAVPAARASHGVHASVSVVKASAEFDPVVQSDASSSASASASSEPGSDTSFMFEYSGDDHPDALRPFPPPLAQVPLSLTTDDYERLGTIGIPLKRPGSTPEKASLSHSSNLPNPLGDVSADMSADMSTVSIPNRVSPGQLARQKAKAQAAASGSRVILNEMRKRRQLERMLQGSERDLAGAVQKDPPKEGCLPFWRRKKDPEGLSCRQLTHRITELKRRRQLDQIFALLEEAKSKGRKPNTISMNAAMAACVHCGDIERVLDLYDEMISPDGCGVDSITYGTLLKGLGKARRLDDAFEVLESMEAGTAPGRPELTEVHLNTLVNACADAGDARRARSVMKRFRAFFKGSIGPSVLTYNLLIKGYARSDNPLEALQLVEEMQLLGLPLERVSYNSLILACIRGDDLERALDYLQEMKAESWKRRDSSLWPDNVSYTTILKGLAEDGDLEGVLNLVQEMKNGTSHFVSSVPESSGSNGGTGTGIEARDKFLEEIKSTCFMDRVAYSAIIDACLTVGSPSDALVFLGEMEELGKTDQGMRPRAHVFLALMRAFAGRGALQETLELKQRLSGNAAAGRVWPEDFHEAHELVLEAAVVSGEISKAEEQFQAMMPQRAASNAWRLSDRGIEAVVRLSASSHLPMLELQPVQLKEEVVPRAAVDVVMRSLSDTCTLSVGAKKEHLESLLNAGNAAVPVLGRAGDCVGILMQEHLDRWNDISEADSGLLSASSLQRPPCISRFASIGDAAALLVSSNSPLLVVLRGDRRHQSGLVKYKSSDIGERVVVGFVMRDMLF